MHSAIGKVLNYVVYFSVIIFCISLQMRLSVLTVFLAAVASASAVSFFSVVLEEWESFKVRYYFKTKFSKDTCICNMLLLLLNLILRQ